MSAFVHTRIIKPIRSLLQQGLNPDSLALSLSLGFVLAFFPVFGITTLLCVLAAGIFRLNQVAIQIANYCGYPLQFVLFIPFIRFGENLFGLEPVSIDPLQIIELAKNDFGTFLTLYGTAIAAACVAWFITAVPAVLILWKGLTALFRLKQP